MTRGRSDADQRNALDSSGVPSRESFWDWLLCALDAERDRKDASVGPVSERHARALEETRYELLRSRGLWERGYSQQLVSKSTLLETAIELLYAHVFEGRRIP